MTDDRRDLPGALLAFAFVLLLLASEAALTLPAETAGDTPVARFYAAHRGAVVGLQLAGLLAAGVLAAYALRLRRVDRAVGNAALLTAVLACAPAVVTIVLALIADPADPAGVRTWNDLEPRADDLLFVGITVFGATVALRLRSPVARVLGGLVAVLFVVRFVLEVLGRERGWVDSLGPILFVVLVGTLGVLSARGRLEPARRRRVGV
jgi:hypothetical protein